MSLTFRHVNKFASLFSITAPRTHKLQHSFALNQVVKNDQEIICPKSCKTVFSDNRELLSDIIQKEQVYGLDKVPCSSPFVRFSQEVERNNVLDSKEEKKSDKVLSSNPSDNLSGRPSPEKLFKVYEQMCRELPNFFYQTLDYSHYHADMVFEDNIRNLRTEGIFPYVRQMALIRMLGHIKFAYVKMEVLKITMHPEEGTIKVRWRIRGVSALQVMLKFWKYKVWDYRKILDKSVHWYDGFSIFYVNSNGFIVKHVAEKMMPDDDRITQTTPSDDLGAAKLALIVGLLPRFADFTSLM